MEASRARGGAQGVVRGWRLFEDEERSLKLMRGWSECGRHVRVWGRLSRSPGSVKVRRGFRHCWESVRGWGPAALSGGCVGTVRTGGAALGFLRAPGCAELVSQKVWGPLPPGQDIGGQPSAPVRGKRRALSQLRWGKSSAARTRLGVFFLNEPLTPCRTHARGLRWWDPERLLLVLQMV